MPIHHQTKASSTVKTLCETKPKWGFPNFELNRGFKRQFWKLNFHLLSDELALFWKLKYHLLSDES